MAVGKELFISYSRADMRHENWLDRLKLYLAQTRRIDGIDSWTDSRIQAGEEWKLEIERALDEAQAAVLIVGPGFLASPFINDVELPRILAAQRKQGMAVFPVVVGYCQYADSVLGPHQAFNDHATPLESLSVADQNRVLNEVSVAVSESLRAQLRVEDTSVDSPSARHLSLRELVDALRKAGTAFHAQIKRRDELVSQIRTKIGITESVEYERFFVRFFLQMDNDDKFLFEQIRAMTEGPLRAGNEEALSVLENHPQLLETYPRLVDLQQHLVFWLNKYDRVFARREDMCLLYTGVEDGVGYPPGLDEELKTALTERS